MLKRTSAKWQSSEKHAPALELTSHYTCPSARTDLALYMSVFYFWPHVNLLSLCTGYVIPSGTSQSLPGGYIDFFVCGLVDRSVSRERRVSYCGTLVWLPEKIVFSLLFKPRALIYKRNRLFSYIFLNLQWLVYINTTFFVIWTFITIALAMGKWPGFQMCATRLVVCKRWTHHSEP
jgi:hypothetical protein